MSDRVEQFTADVAELKIKDPAAGRDGLLVRLGGFLMVVGVLFSLAGYLAARSSDDPLNQGGHHALGLLGLTLAIVGAAVFVRYSLAGFFKLWLARYLHAQRTGE